MQRQANLRSLWHLPHRKHLFKSENECYCSSNLLPRKNFEVLFNNAHPKRPLDANGTFKCITGKEQLHHCRHSVRLQCSIVLRTASRHSRLGVLQQLFNRLLPHFILVLSLLLMHKKTAANKILYTDVKDPELQEQRSSSGTVSNSDPHLESTLGLHAGARGECGRDGARVCIGVHPEAQQVPLLIFCLCIILQLRQLMCGHARAVDY